jgi:predicted HTH transcriptional regulator
LNKVFQNSVSIRYSSGIGRIIHYCKEANLPLPTFRLTQGSAFENHSGGFLVTVYAPDNDKSKKNVTENKNNDPVNDLVNDPVNDRLSEIKKLITNNKHITREELARRCAVSVETIKRDILKLKKNNELIRIGSDKSGHCLT